MVGAPVEAIHRSVVSAHVALVRRKSGARWYLRGRHADGRTFQRCLGRAWVERTRPPAGYLTKKMALAARDAFVADARRGLGDEPTNGAPTFGEVCESWLDWVE